MDKEKLIKQHIKKYIKCIANILVILSVTFILVFISEFLIHGDAADVLRWMKYYDVEFLLTYLLVGILLAITTFACNHIGYGYLCTAIPVCTISIVNYYKLDMKGEQLSFQDFALAGELATMAGDLEISISMHLIWGVTFALIMALLLKEINFINFKKRFRSLGLVMCLIGVFSVYEISYGRDKVISHSFLLNLMNSAHVSDIKEPELYNKQKVDELLQKGRAAVVQPSVKPNVIMIMEESLFDPNTLEDVTLSKDPLENFHKYQEDFVGGNIIGPKIGGYTAQTEYEVLTGNSTDFTGVSNVAYMRYIDKNVHSMVGLFKKQGYATTAIHPYDGNFYSRDVVYKDMGFDEFITRDDFVEPKIINDFIADEEAFDRLIKEYEGSSNQPFFAHMVTMQNHTPYNAISNPTIRVEDEELSELTRDTLESYTTSLEQTDLALKELIGYFEKVDEPTIIVVYGDHIPILGEEVYEELGYLEVEQAKDYVEEASTPFFIWNNYGLEQKDYEYIDASYLGAVVLDYIGFKQDPYFNYLYEQLDEIKSYHSHFYVDGEGAIKGHEEITLEQATTLEDMWVLQYDKVFGKGYYKNTKKK